MANSGKNRRILYYLLSYDTNLIVAVIFVIVFGLIMIYSASYYTASIRESYNYDPTFLLKSQLKYSIVGLVVMLLVANINYRTWRYFAVLGFFGSAVLILLLLVPGLGYSANGATRWLTIPGLGRFQVAEPVKVAMIIFSAAFICKFASALNNLLTFIKVMIPTAVISVMILLISDNMSTAVIVFGISFLMAFMVYPKYYPFVIMAAVGAVFVVVVIYYTMEYADSDSAFRIARIQAWLDPYSYESDKAYQSLQALYAIGSGGLFGKGLGNSIQKLGAIPEAYNDMIFAIVCEELGIFGAEDLCGRLLTIGVFSHVALQVILNLMVVTSLFPTTGVTLPFFSYGGTATVFLLVEIGMVLNVEKESRFKREREMRESRLE